MAEEKKVVKQVDVVAQDRNWVLRINSELDSEKQWDSQFGYLSNGKSHLTQDSPPKGLTLNLPLTTRSGNLKRYTMNNQGSKGD